MYLCYLPLGTQRILHASLRLVFPENLYEMSNNDKKYLII